MKFILAICVGIGLIAFSSYETVWAAVSHRRSNSSLMQGTRPETPILLRLKNTQTNEPISLSECNCKIVVYDAEQNEVSHPTLQADVINGVPVVRSRVVFPAPGAYSIVLTGESKGGTFPPFTMRYPVNAR